MARIEALGVQSSPQMLRQTRELFEAYGEFLRTSGGHALFCFSRLEQEIVELPAAYNEHGGEVLLAIEEPDVAGCVAYRAMTGHQQVERCCEIKRLFVNAGYRGRGLGRELVSAALQRASQRGYQWACLDTEPQSMDAAHRLYRELGFVEDQERQTSPDAPVIYLKKHLA